MMKRTDKIMPLTGILSLFCFVCVFSAPSVYSQSAASENSILLNRAEEEFDNGNYAQAIELANLALAEVKGSERNIIASKSLDLIGCSQISLMKLAEAEPSFEQSLEFLPASPNHSFQKARVYIHFAWLYRQQRKYDKSLEYLKNAITLVPNNNYILGEYYLNVGRIFFSKGFDISAIVWLEKAEKLLENANNTGARLDTLRFLSLAWQAKLNYPVALSYAEKLVSLAEKTRFKDKHRQALLDLGNILSATGQKEKNFQVLKRGLRISIEHKNVSHTGLFLSQLLLNSLYDNDLRAASDYLAKLEAAEKNKLYFFEITLAKAVLAAFGGETEKSEKLFEELEKNDAHKGKILPTLYWKITVAEKARDWNKVITLNQRLLEVTLKNNYLEDLPGIFLMSAKAHFNLKQHRNAAEYLEKSLAYIENIRSSENVELSINLFETYHTAYRLLAEIKSDTPEKAFELSDFLKARLLKDKINDSLLKKDRNLFISARVRQKIEELSLKMLDDRSIESEIGDSESDVTNKLPELNIAPLDFKKLDQTPAMNDTAILSYLFANDGRLMAFVWQKDVPLKVVYLPINEEETNKVAAETFQKLKQYIFFKQDGKAIFDKLLKPLSIQAKHLIIIPDKSLWKIPFQALSGDGKTYLIENQTISYAPSVSILLSQLNVPKISRRTFQVFSNSLYNNLFLKFANAEAESLAKIYHTRPHLDATVGTFKMAADKSDILHYSMHAEINSGEPFNSFLAFKPAGGHNGRLTVGELLKIKVKSGSLVFLASCDTQKVISGEGVVSLTWGMMGAGATTVISAQWEANDQSTIHFTKSFYKHYKQGVSAAEAMQKASLEMIGSDSNDFSEPYHWAEFTLNGDYR